MKKILIVDDEISVVELLTVAFNMEGFEVLYAMDANQGLQQAFQHKPDLIILDVMLPGESGLALHQKLKKSILTQDIPVIFLTALSSQQLRKDYQGLNEKESVVFRKPWNVQDLARKAREILREKGPSSGAAGTPP